MTSETQDNFTGLHNPKNNGVAENWVHLTLGLPGARHAPGLLTARSKKHLHGRLSAYENSHSWVPFQWLHQRFWGRKVPFLIYCFQKVPTHTQLLNQAKTYPQEKKKADKYIHLKSCLQVQQIPRPPEVFPWAHGEKPLVDASPVTVPQLQLHNLKFVNKVISALCVIAVKLWVGSLALSFPKKICDGQ